VKDYYKILNVERDASSKDIKDSFRRLAKQYHPDVNKNNPKANEIFKEINEANSILSDETKRADYDKKMFAKEESRDTNKPNEGRAYRQKDMTMEDFVNTSSYFEDFFGFNPNSESKEYKIKDKNVKPMSTKDAFDAIFVKKNFRK